MEKSGLLHDAAALPRYPLYRRLGEPQSRPKRYGKEKNILSLPGIEPWFLGHMACSPIATPTVPSRLTTVYMIYIEKSIYDLI
jgi:hypothetical protein